MTQKSDRKRWNGAFSGKSVLIVGGSSGIGRVVALRMADSGARLAVTARRVDKLLRLRDEIVGRGGVCLALPADAQEESAAAVVVEKAATELGRIDLVLLNAGGAPALDMRKMSAAEVKACMRANYDVVVNYLFPVLDQMRRQGGGIVAHTNSLAGLIGVPLQGPYCAAKGAAKLLLDTCRIEFAEFGIRFVTVYPGFVATDATADDGMPAPMEISEDDAADRIMNAIARERSDSLFPFPMSALVRLGRVLPTWLRSRILAMDLPRLDVEVGASADHS